jgi:hypothetical protein
MALVVAVGHPQLAQVERRILVALVALALPRL